MNDHKETLGNDGAVQQANSSPQSKEAVSESDLKELLLMEIEICRLADKWMDLRDEGADQHVLKEAEELLDSKITNRRTFIWNLFPGFSAQGPLPLGENGEMI